ncbi:MarR family winged helix-turn-helix transcriptional regulator [Sphingomonas sp. 35-24ZXX]|uniref:MarR family winged helix-turn-helix transcriptional regulator n=1 Tax=Sphingomonas sp. 35-24ZXX TaxID=1545915 RepID=UPI00053BFB68|nr:MarR family transcriptional regulator [Sphingomonas sp. 35-24ZXX]
MTDLAVTDAEPGRLADPLEDLLGYWLRRASGVMMADLGVGMAEADLRPTEATILILIRANPGLTQSDIGRVLGIARANMAPLMGRLQKRGFIQKVRVDGRSQALTLTEGGMAKVEVAQAIIDAHEARFQSRIDPQMLPGMISSLRALVGT